MTNDKKRDDKSEEDLPNFDDFEESDNEEIIDDNETYDDVDDYYEPDELVAACLTIACELNKIRRKHHEDDKAYAEVKKTFEAIMEKLKSRE